jgi:hypothetical protein
VRCGRGPCDELASVPVPARRSSFESAGYYHALRDDSYLGEAHPMTPIKVLIAIPNMGFTQVEAYGNRLMNFMQLGNLQTERASFYKFAQILDELAPSMKEAVLNNYLENHARHIQKKEDELIEFWFINIGRIFTPAAREEAAKKALEHNMDYIFFVDDDMICPDDMFLRLYKSTQKSGADVICPLAFTRNEPYKPVLYASIEGYDAVNRSDYFINNVVMNYPRNKLVEADACGFGAALIKVAILRKIEPPYFMCSSGTGEDILFCYKVRKAGGRVFMDTTFNIGHLGHPQVITEDFVDSYRNSVDPENKKRYGEFTKYNALTVLGE